ncbi:UDP-forming cellulose synthase catalytic subunit [Methylobacterium indicum]|uniref:UDP-forming cellulose synthase catalytic subunit n=2 Tax=Methylobacterium indicum TaxID=1775910 RepID=UPI000AE8F652|nr:UDP-forming cellulose synthase catalytic subunit [Methylobacterium indicum]
MSEPSTSSEFLPSDGTSNEANPDRPQKLIEWLLAGFGLILTLIFVTVLLEPKGQAILAVVCFGLFLLANRRRGRGTTVFLAVLSVLTSFRYMFWRVTDTLTIELSIESFLGLLLIIAECYAVTILVLGYIQNIWPLNRKPVPLPADVDAWPAVDVFVPTYNESLSIVRTTVLACTMMDWPSSRLRVYILDDGNRDEFRRFADQVGVGYITRTDNKHAKAGNLNNAMRHTDAEYIAVFDCDHIPTRAFLQVTMGWMVRDKRLALLQTPHHFYSPDPFQRNLTAGTRVPPEGNMFYGLVQDGNDFWNASFFCGSCAVLRRSALDEIGGFAVETVTEDAHTMLKLHRKGWESAYLKLPLAAGLATERLALHIGQRARWARGMIQILRVDNPVLGRGLTWAQRICYLQAGGHFLFAIPRIIFLLSPLAFLLLGQNIVSASPLAITAYALPHIALSVAVNSRMQRNWRHSFWSEIYETVLAMFLVRTTLVTLVNPRRGKFNVTAKGGLLEKGYFDLGAVYPNLVLAALLIAGIARGVVSLIVVDNDLVTFQALLLNSIWATFSLLIVMAALAVGRERRQTRALARVRASIHAELRLPDGEVLSGTTRDLSETGADLQCALPRTVPNGCPLEVRFHLGGEELVVPAQVLRSYQDVIKIMWAPRSIEDEMRIVQVVFGRADAWANWSNFKTDRPMVSLWRVLVSIRGLFRLPEGAKSTAGRGLSVKSGGGATVQTFVASEASAGEMEMKS